MEYNLVESKYNLQQNVLVLNMQFHELYRTNTCFVQLAALLLREKRDTL